jgi:hypothetical protein
MRSGEIAATGAYGQSFSAVIAYEDFQCGVRAMESFALLLQEIDPAEHSVKVWKFEPLGIPQLLADAVEDAISADLLIVSLRGDRPLPLEARQWIEGWRSLKPRMDAALLMVIDPCSRQTCTSLLAGGYLETVAAGCGLQFFSSPPALTAGQRFSAPVITRTALSPVSYDSWGLNE